MVVGVGQGGTGDSDSLQLTSSSQTTAIAVMTAAGRGSAAATAAAGGGAAGVPTAPNPAAAPQPHAELAASAGSTAPAGSAATATLVAGAPKQGTATGPVQDDVRRAAETTAPLSDPKVQKRKVAMFLAYVGAGYLVSHERILCAVMLGNAVPRRPPVQPSLHHLCSLQADIVAG